MSGAGVALKAGGWAWADPLAQLHSGLLPLGKVLVYMPSVAESRSEYLSAATGRPEGQAPSGAGSKFVTTTQIFSILATRSCAFAISCMLIDECSFILNICIYFKTIVYI